MLLAPLALLGFHVAPLRYSRHAAVRCAAPTTTAIEFGGIPHVGVIVGSAAEALTFYTEVLGMVDATGSEEMEVPGACVRVGEQTIRLMELPTPDPLFVDPSYNMSMPPPGCASRNYLQHTCNTHTHTACATHTRARTHNVQRAAKTVEDAASAARSTYFFTRAQPGSATA
eukprot:7376340-Prymnesium_polylepis.2